MRITSVVRIFLCLLLFSACQNNDSHSSGNHNRYIYGDHSVNDPLPNEAFFFEAKVNYINFTSDQQDKLREALEIIKEIVATEEFRNRILNHRYNNDITFVDSNGYTNAQIYQIILEASEKLSPAINHAMDLEVELYYQNTNVVGYTYPSSPRIWVNSKYFNSYNLASVARNIFHEWLHKLGFNHASVWAPSRDYSVPYAIGDIVEDLGKNYL